MPVSGVEGLLEAVKQLPPDDLAQFTARFTQWHESVDLQPAEEFLIQQTRQLLGADDQKRLEKLAAKSERQTLSTAELSEYRNLADRCERINALRVRALAELAHRRNQSIQAVKKEIGWQELRNGS